MRLHSNIHTWQSVHDALTRAKRSGKVPEHVHFEQLTEHGSRKRSTAFEIKLATYTKEPGDGRRRPNTGNRGTDISDGLWAATYDEWGWFIAELFAHDKVAVFGHYVGLAGFDAATRFKYEAVPA